MKQGTYKMKKTIIALSLMPALAFAADDARQAILEANYKVLEAQGLPTPKGGVLQVVPSDQIKMAEWQKQKIKSDEAQMKKNGYVRVSSNRAYELIHIESKIKKGFAAEKGMFKGNGSQLRERHEDIPFAYTYAPIPKDSYKVLFGIAPVGTYIQEGQTGWTGAVSFFETDFAQCAYTEDNLVAAHGAARVEESVASYEVNDKVTVIDVEGNESTGFLYRVNWFDSVFNHNLECATPAYSKESTKKTIELAKKIDMK